MLSKEVHSMNWITSFPTPSRQEIDTYQKHNTRRSPYLCAQLDIPNETRYREYTVEFRAMHLPLGTYCCLGCWAMDYGDAKPCRDPGEWADAYAGFQRIIGGRTTSIMSVWDRWLQIAPKCKRHISATRLYPPEVIDGGRFWGEGTGARSSAPFFWEADHWYRMHLKIVPSAGTSLLEQRVWDLETGAYTLLCRYDLGVANVSFLGSMAVFLENYLPKYAGELRSLQVRNARYLPVGQDRWRTVTKAWTGSCGGLPEYEGSYDFGSSQEGLWMITSGVGGDWYANGKGKSPGWVSL